MNSPLKMFNSKSSDLPTKLDEVIDDAKKADGFLVTVSSLKKDTLYHTYITSNFKKNDILPSMNKIIQLLEPETK